jgi:cation transport regulator ChaB
VPVPYFDSVDEYVGFLESTLIPDLKDSGRSRMAMDFEEAIYWIMTTNTDWKRAYDKLNMPKPKTKKKRVASAYNKLYSKAFKMVQDKYKKKSGQWKKDGFKLAQKAAHKLARQMMKKK